MPQKVELLGDCTYPVRLEVIAEELIRETGTRYTSVDGVVNTIGELRSDIRSRSHPAANMFPWHSFCDQIILALDLLRYGQIEPVYIHDREIIDGRNLEVSSLLAGQKPKHEAWVSRGETVEEFIGRRNLLRRDLNPSQRAAFAVELLPGLELAALERRRAGKDLGPNVVGGRAGEIAGVQCGGVGREYVRRAKNLKETCPAAFRLVQKGKLKIPTADKVAALPKHQQGQVIRAVGRGISLRVAFEDLEPPPELKALSLAKLDDRSGHPELGDRLARQMSSEEFARLVSRLRDFTDYLEGRQNTRILPAIREEKYSPTTQEAQRYIDEVRRYPERVVVGVNEEFAKTILSRLKEPILIQWSGRLKTSAGKADSSSRTIHLSPNLTWTLSEFRDTVLHELAHILVAGLDGGHGPVWKKVHMNMGGSGKRCHTLPVKRGGPKRLITKEQR